MNTRISDLRTLHDELVETLGLLAELTSQPSPDEAALGTVRYRLSRISGARRKLVNALCDTLAVTAPAADALRVRELRDANMALFHHSTGHVGSWSLRDIMKDWSGYRAASVGMRRAMFVQIDAEKATLYPLLHQ